jgi:hypothetical protein
MTDPSPLRPTSRGGRRGGRPEYSELTDLAAAAATHARDRLEREAAERDRKHRRRLVAGAAIATVAALIIGTVVAFATVDRETTTAAPEVVRPFDALGASGVGVPGAVAASFSPNGTQLAVRRGGGSLGIAKGGQFQPIVPAETQIVAFAWFGTSRLLVQEGPVATGQLAIVGVDGTDHGAIRLDPDVSPGNGIGVSPDGALAVLSSFGDATFGGEPIPVDLWLVDLRSGATRRLSETPGDVEGDPLFLDAETVIAMRRAGPGDVAVIAIDVTTGSVKTLAVAGPASRIIGTVGGGGSSEVAWTDGSTGRTRVLARAPAGASIVAIDPAGQRLIVRDTSENGADTQLRLVEI